MERIYRVLLGLYPHDFRLWFGAEMEDAFAKSAAGVGLQGRAVRLGFVMAELSGLTAGAMVEWFAKWTGDRDARARSLPDWRMMRPVGISKEAWFGKARRPCSSDT